jgi:glutaryl-CoA dehydrogenase (non-decarboxylating)
MKANEMQEQLFAKWFSFDATFEVANDGFKSIAHYNYSNEYPAERYLRNAKVPVI